MKIEFSHHKNLVVEIAGRKRNVRRSYNVNKILSGAEVINKLTAYPITITLSPPEIILSKLITNAQRRREPILYLSSYIVGRDVYMVGHKFFNGQRFSHRGTTFFKEEGKLYREIEPNSEEMRMIESAYKSANVLEGL